MIALGVAPGIAALAYSVVEYDDGAHEVGDALDSDVLKGGRGVSVESAWEIAKRFRAHHLILDVVCDRHAPAVLALGPPANPKEDPDHVAAVRLLLGTLAKALGVQLVAMIDRPTLLGALGGIADRQLAQTVRAEVPNFTGFRDRRIVLATAAAMAGARAYVPPPSARGR